MCSQTEVHARLSVNLKENRGSESELPHALLQVLGPSHWAFRHLVAGPSHFSSFYTLAVRASSTTTSPSWAALGTDCLAEHQVDIVGEMPPSATPTSQAGWHTQLPSRT